MNKIRKNTSLILTFFAIVFLSLAFAFSNVGMNNVKASSSDNPEGFVLEVGTDVAVSDEFSGIRLETKVSKTYYNGLKEEYPDATFSFGTWIVPVGLVSGIQEINENLAGSLNIEAYSEGVVQNLEGSIFDYNVVSYYSIIDYDSIVSTYTALHQVDPDNYPLDNAEDVKANAYKLLIMARSYVKIETGDAIEYNYSGVEFAQSARLVAAMAIVSGKTISSSENYNAVLDFIGGTVPTKSDIVVKYNILHNHKTQSFAFPELVGKTIDEISFNSAKIDYVFNGEDLFIKTDIAPLVNGEENYLIAYTSEGIIYREVEFVNIIETPDDFVKAFSLAKGDLTTADSLSKLAVFDKEYYLANNIDFKGYNMPTETYTYTGRNYYSSNKIIKAGLTGTFDGQGYAIYNLVAPQGGLFGLISGTIKDVAFINCSINNNKSTHSGFLAQMISAGATVKNVYVKLIDKVSVYKHFAGTYLEYTMVFNNCYFEGDLSLLLSPITNTNGYHTSALTNTNNKAIIITKQMLGSRNEYGVANGIEGNLAGTTEKRPYYGSGVASDGDLDGTGANQHPRKNRISGKFYRYESIEDMLEYYNGNYSQTEPLKALLESFNNEEVFSVIDGKIIWKNDYSLFNGDEKLNNQVNLYAGEGNNEASFSVKDCLGNVVEGFTYELVNNNGVVALEGSKITMVDLGEEELLVKKANVVYFTIKVIVTKPTIDMTSEKPILLDANGEEVTIADGTIIGGTVEGGTVIVKGNSIALSFADEAAAANKEYVVGFETADKIYNYKVKYVTAYIRTAEEFVSTFALAKGELTNASTLDDLATFDGYYVLANNIDFAGKAMPTETFVFNASKHYLASGAYETAKTKGLSGTFDGNGYAIYNVKAPKGGLFGIIAGTVKNVAFINIDIADGANGGLLAAMFAVNGKISNAYIDYSAGYKASTYAIANLSRYQSIAVLDKVYVSAEIALFKNVVYAPTEKATVTQYGSTFDNANFIYISKQSPVIGSGTYRIYEVKGNKSADNKPLLNNATATVGNGGYVTLGSANSLRFNSVNAEGDAFSLVSSYETYKTIIDGYNGEYFEVGPNGKIAWIKDTVS